MKSNKLSVYVLAFNEESKIEDCLKSVTWADEVVVIDSHSTDGTTKIAKRFGAKVVQVDFEGFGGIRDAGITYTQYNWILSIDSDERCSSKVKQEILSIINRDESKDVYYIPRRNIFMGKKIRFCGWYPDYRQPQLFRRGKMTYASKDQVHEGYNIAGTTGYLKNSIIQIPFLNYSEMIKKMDRYTELGSQKLLSRKKKVSSVNIVVRSIWAFFLIYIIKLGFLDGWRGVVIAFCNMEGTFLKYAKYKELLRNKITNC